MSRSDKEGVPSPSTECLTALRPDACDTYPAQRMKEIQDVRSHLDEVGIEIFTSGIKLGIVLLLLKMESACVCEIQFVLNEPRQSLVSHHLRQMKKAGWLESERWKTWMFYRLVGEKKEPLSRLIQSVCQTA
jgi:DNA-binding transcriptional ArsR family regulator